MKNIHPEILAKGAPTYTPLFFHLLDTSLIAQKFAKHLNYNKRIARYWGILHDIGKVSPLQQIVMKDDYVFDVNREVFRHEICSLFFISCFPRHMWNSLIEAISCHHKSSFGDENNRGLIDLIDTYGFDYIFNRHAEGFEEWVNIALDILESFGIKRIELTREKAYENLKYAYEYLVQLSSSNGISELKGMLIGSDHFSSALGIRTREQIDRLFKTPNLDYYHNRASDSVLYPLATKNILSNKRHSIIIAPTGSGKTDCALKRTKGRIVYVLPFMASINSMYERLANTLAKDNDDLDIRVLHSTSKLTVKNGTITEKVLQSKIGASIKVTTPHQLLEIVFGVKGYEATLCDIKGCDIILDEIHTYSDTIQASVIKLIEMLAYNDCNVHVCTATIPTKLKEKIINILGVENVEIIKLNDNEKASYNRYLVHKCGSGSNGALSDFLLKRIKESIDKNEKVIVVRNRVVTSQITYTQLKRLFPDIPIILIHSRFKRGHRNELERRLFELNVTEDQPCIVISTQVIEVSLDISYDMLISDCSTIDSLIQRFGRIFRIRSHQNLGKTADVYVIEPPKNEYEASPYSLKYLKRTFEILKNNEILDELKIQEYIDYVYDDVIYYSVDAESIINEGNITIPKMTHKPKSKLYEQFDISSATLITESDVDIYETSNYDERLAFEIPIQYYVISKMNLNQLESGAFIIQDKFYDDSLGLIV